MARAQLVGRVVNKHIMVLLLGWLCHCYGMASVYHIIINSLTAFTYNKHLHSCSLLLALCLFSLLTTRCPLLFADCSLLIPPCSSVAAHCSLLIAYFSLLFTCCSISSPTIIYPLQLTLTDPYTVSHCNDNLCSPDTDSQPVSQPHKSPECPRLHAHHHQREIKTKMISPSETGEGARAAGELAGGSA
jgi:hypothetical protein